MNPLITQALDSTSKRFDEEFPCIDPNCDGNGVTWHVIMGHDSYGEEAPEQEQLQCQYCHEQRFPYKEAFHQSNLELLAAVRETVEGMKTKETPNVSQGYPKMIGYNRAIDDLLTALSEGNKNNI